MKREEYDMVQELLIGQSQVFMRLPLEEFLAMIERADAVGPVLDPTLWRDRHADMYLMRDLAKGALAFQVAAKKYARELDERRHPKQ